MVVNEGNKVEKKRQKEDTEEGMRNRNADKRFHGETNFSSNTGDYIYISLFSYLNFKCIDMQTYTHTHNSCECQRKFSKKILYLFDVIVSSWNGHNGRTISTLCFTWKWLTCWEKIEIKTE